jgi:hypothetical protein
LPITHAGLAADALPALFALASTPVVLASLRSIMPATLCVGKGGKCDWTRHELYGCWLGKGGATGVREGKGGVEVDEKGSGGAEEVEGYQ